MKQLQEGILQVRVGMGMMAQGQESSETLKNKEKITKTDKQSPVLENIIQQNRGLKSKYHTSSSDLHKPIDAGAYASRNSEKDSSKSRNSGIHKNGQLKPSSKMGMNL